MQNYYRWLFNLKHEMIQHEMRTLEAKANS